MRLHIAEKQRSSWSMRGWLVMKTSGLPFEEVLYFYQEDLAQQRAEWANFSPTSKVPVLEDGETRVWDTLGIALYIGERAPHIWAENNEARAWSYAAVAEMHSGFEALREQCNFRITSAPEEIEPDAALLAELARLNQLWTEGLNRFGGSYLAGDHFTVVDAFYAPVTLRLKYYDLLEHLSPAARHYALKIADSDWVREWCAQA